MSFQMPAPIFRDPVCFRVPGLGAAPSAGERIVTEGLESSDSLPTDILEGKLPPTTGWFTLMRLTFEVIQLLNAGGL